MAKVRFNRRNSRFDRACGRGRMGTRERPQRPGHRYASAELRGIWSPSTRCCWSVSWARGAGGPARPRDRGAGRGGRGLPRVVDLGEKGVDLESIAARERVTRRRREGADRGVLGARRPRAHPQGHDLARPDRERGAAAGSSSRSPWSATGPSPALARLARLAARARTTVMAGRSHNVARPRRPRWASGSPRSPTRCSSRSTGSRTCSPVTRCAASRPDGHRAGHARPARRRRRRSWPRSSSAWRSTSASRRCSPASPGLPRSLDLDVVSALVQLVAGPPTSPPRSG